ncbi:hypothetical protein PHYBLDRAFT_112334 [Phycomyces blakesleeanus NRRL 1555(-)]|uniref:Cyclase n=1 Tax=Phycomyces blakesleeanus (strain ATCC 8743b / DSM 1359 / FGSC 10004 / NBRC 33097 / NRRL 1555) TaxID=763407 RepID=A0A162NET4_PHYB8|nr:hypothetical protein PHYBLDRAFT_112334 [Phycomyces blakesleeanus NRRL 1555(-)]OAD73698.1 hypothetical protein PHYBLDRAFT_112334 [Phycomyces blakesleeanus NRRL 1555(-)]|eukprot:XP_018291738.1 hypothetical protein PHYBLDRAFT_112334 [Phycomyces blakesleeanus NRRL 1555(-)]
MSCCKGSLPSYDQLPVDSTAPPHSAWGLWGKEDNLGTLNLLTPEKVERAGKLIRRGEVYSLNWKLECPDSGMLDRYEPKHSIKPLGGGISFDDVYDNFNTQASSQWDGLRHFCHIGSGKFYNNISASDITDSSEGRLGIHHMARRGIAGRAVLLDFGRWAVKNAPEFDPFKRHEITVQQLEAVAASQKVKFEEGDVLLIRTGWTAAYEVKKANKGLPNLKGDVENLPVCAGIKACEETFSWVWNNHFSALASDSIALEAMPFDFETSYSIFLGGWGMPIGELFFLEALADDSAKDGVYEYFFTSAPLNKHGGVATPPNALCIK